jgi:hypothetical protein
MTTTTSVSYLTSDTEAPKTGNTVVINANLARILTTTAGVSVFLQAAAAESVATMIENISKTQGDGKAYKRNGRVHVASSPGKFPAKDTGELADSFNITSDQKGEQITLTIEAPYALILELGNSRMASRPFIIRSINEAFNTKLPTIFKQFIGILNQNPGLFEKLYLTYILGLKDKLSDRAFANLLKRRGFVGVSIP